MSLSVPFLGRLTGLDKSGAPEAAEAASPADGIGTIERLLIANHDIVMPRNVVGKLSFVCDKSSGMILALRGRG